MTWRTALNRPFQPGHDVIPPIWAGRSRELDDWESTLRARRVVGLYERGRAILGEAGIGKTALTAKIAASAAAAGDLVVEPVRVPRGADVIALLARALGRTSEAESVGTAVAGRVVELLDRVRAVSGVQIAPRRAEPNPHVALRELIIELGRVAAARGRTLLIRIDEVQNIRDTDQLSAVLTALADALAHTEVVRDAAGTRHERVLPIAVYLTALPEFLDEATAAAGATFARRFRPMLIGHLDDADLRLALAPFTSPTGWPIGEHAGVAMTEDAVDALLACSLGDPLLFQLIGAAAWSAAPDEQVITADHIRAGFDAEHNEAVGHVERLLERVPARERALLEAMAGLRDTERTLSRIAQRLDVAPTRLGPAAQRLERRRLIRRGRPYTFTARTVEAYLQDRWP